MIVDRIILHHRRIAGAVHQDYRAPAVARALHAVGGMGQGGDIVDQRGACGRRRGHGSWIAGVDRHRMAGRRETANHRQYTVLFLRRGGRFGAGPGRFAADVDDRRAGAGHRPGMGDCCIRGAECAAVGKTIRRHIDDAHQFGRVEGNPAEGCAGRSQSLDHRGHPRSRSGIQAVTPGVQVGYRQPGDGRSFG